MVGSEVSLIETTKAFAKLDAKEVTALGAEVLLLGVYKTKTKDQDLNSFIPFQGTDSLKTKPKHSSVQTDAKSTGSSFCVDQLFPYLGGRVTVIQLNK